MQNLRRPASLVLLPLCAAIAALAGQPWSDEDSVRAPRPQAPLGERWIDGERFPAAGAELVQFEREVTLPIPAAEAWSLLATPEGWMRFLGVNARIELTVGGPFEIEFDPSAPPGLRGSEGCQVLAWLPERLLVFSWNAPPHMAAEREQRTFVVIEFQTLEPDRTRVLLTHAGFGSDGNWPLVATYFERAWTNLLGYVHATAVGERQPGTPEGR
jgi:uncharacterized protein YndB with AHSA1/START domain